MNNPLHASYYADHALVQTVATVDNHRVARDTYRLRIECPELAACVLPGQFVMVRLHGYQDPLLGRAFALYDIVRDSSGRPWGIDIVYLVTGKLTNHLKACESGDKLDIWGPLGNGFLPRPTKHLVMVAGGIGYTPFPAVASEYLGRERYGDPSRKPCLAERVTLCYGAASADLLAGLNDFTERNVDIHLATDDGTAGHHGLVTDVLQQVLDQTDRKSHIVSCGPEAMLEATCAIAIDRDVSCEVSLEAPMACGIGICFSCVAKVCDESGEWDYQRTCVEGPVFDACRLQW